MEIHIYIIYVLGLLFNGYIFWLLLQLTLASWGSSKAKESWVTVVNTPLMQVIYIKWLSSILLAAITIQFISMVILTAASFYTGTPITLNSK